MTNIITILLDRIEIILKLIYSKPYHTGCVGLCILIVFFWKNLNVVYLMFGLIITVFSIVTIVENIINDKSYKKKMQNYYIELQGFEKTVINHCMKHRRLTYEIDPMDDENGCLTLSLCSLIEKGFGKNINTVYDFIMFSNVYDLLQEVEKKK